MIEPQKGGPYLRVPRIPFWVLPEAEREYGRLVNLSLDFMLFHVMLFRQALSLADFCDQHRNRPSASERDSQLLNWLQLAARDGTVTLYKFYETMQSLRLSLKKTPTLEAYLDQEAIRKACSAFEKHFEGFAGARHGVAHSGKLMQTPEIAAENSIGGQMWISGMVGRTLVSTIKGKAASISLTEKSACMLEQVAQGYFKGYERVAAITQDLDQQSPKGTLQLPD